MLQPADVLLLDEPTNDLDIPTLEILEESLLEFRGSLVLVTHDRYMLDRVSTIVLGLDGQGGAERFADYSQWEAWQAERESSADAAARLRRVPRPRNHRCATKKKLSYLEAREYASIEERVAAAEEILRDEAHSRRGSGNCQRRNAPSQRSRGTGGSPERSRCTLCTLG